MAPATLLLVACASAHSMFRPLASTKPVVRLRSAVVSLSDPAAAAAQEPSAAAESSAAPPPAPEPAPTNRLRRWFQIDKNELSKYGVDAFFTYGVVSNLNVAFMTAAAWGMHSKASGLSPLAPGQWKSFLAVYTALYLSIGFLMRPLRIVFALSVTPLYGRAVSRLRGLLPFGASRPKLNRTLAVVLLSLLLNVGATTLLLCLGAWLAGLVTGVPAVPPGWRWRGGAAL